MRHFLAVLLFALLLVGCDSLTTATVEESYRAAEVATLLGADADRPVAICVPSTAQSFLQVQVPRSEVARELALGAVLPNTGPVDHECLAVAQVVTCPCFSGAQLTAGYDDSVPQPYLHFDTYNWYGLDYRRTEVRAMVDVQGDVVEQVASVYITPGVENDPFLVCYRHTVEPHPYSGEPEYVYVTEEPTVAEAEACRRTLTAFAGGTECQGPACGTPYSKDQLDPAYPEYDLTRPAPENDAIRRTIERAQQFVTRAE